MIERKRYAIVDRTELKAENPQDQLTLKTIEGGDDPDEVAKKLGRDEMVLVELPDEDVFFHSAACDVWLAHALAHGVPRDLAILGREVLVKFEEECGNDSGRAMLTLALVEPQRARERWRMLMGSR